MGPPAGDVANEWDAAAYDDHHSFVMAFGEDLIDTLAPRKGERILDLGCGTGYLTNRIGEIGASVVGIDAARPMIESARATYPTHAFVHADARALPFDGAFDAVFSNAVLHWIRAQDAALQSIAGSLRPGGRLVAEMGGVGNIDSIIRAVEAELAARGYDADIPWYFPSIGEYATELEVSGFEVRYATLFDRPTTLDNGEEGLAVWLDMFGDRFLSPLSADEQASLIAGIEDRLRADHFEDGAWVANYRRLRFVAVLDDT